MNLIIFDIDGTLTQTNEVDSICFAQAIMDVLDIPELNTNWASYKYSTDSGLLNEIFESHFQRLPTEDEINTIKDRFVSYLKQAWLNDKFLYSPILGAETIFRKIQDLSTWHMGIATGAWKSSALFKLESATIPHVELPKSYADDHVERAEIIKKTIKQAQAKHKVSQYEKIIYVGDKPWDKRAAMQLGIGFVGIGHEIMATHQPQDFCLPNYESDTALLEYLQKYERIFEKTT